MKRYQVLWIDDEWEKQSGFITEAEQEDIYIEPYETTREGMEAFVKRIDDWDAIILDAKGYDKSVDEIPDLDCLYSAISKIEELKSKRNIPWFVLTGQPDRMGNPDFEKSLRGRKPYSKNIAADKEKLFKDIKNEADNNFETQIRHEYAAIFSTNVDKATILKVLTALKNNDNKNPAHLNDIRKIMEDIFDECIDKGIISSSLTRFNERSIALCDRNLQGIVPAYIQRNIHSVVEITQTGSHRTQTDQDIRSGVAPYLVCSTISELLNIILWWDGYKKANP
jgi:hypothetical protein